MHIILIANVDPVDDDGLGTLWRKIPEDIFEDFAVDIIHHLPDLDDYDKAVLRAQEASPDFEILYWAGDV